MRWILGAVLSIVLAGMSLAEDSDPSVTELIRAVKDKQSGSFLLEERVYAVRLAGADKQAVGELRKLIRDQGDPVASEEAVPLLSMLDDAVGAADILMGLLQDGKTADARLRGLAAQALGQLDQPAVPLTSANSPLYPTDWRPRLDADLRVKVVGALRQVIENKNEGGQVRAAAARSLGYLADGSDRSFQTLYGVAADPKEWLPLRIETADALANRYRGDPEPVVTSGVSSGVGDKKPAAPTAEERLLLELALNLLKEQQSPRLQIRSVALLYRLGPKARGAAPRLLEIIQRDDHFPDVTAQAVQTILVIEPKEKEETARALGAALMPERPPQVRRATAAALSQLLVQAGFSPLDSAGVSDVTAWKPLIRKFAFDSLLIAVKEKDSGLARDAIAAVGALSDDATTGAAAVGPLAAELKRTDPDIRGAAAGALELVGAPAKEALPALTEIIRWDPVEQVRTAALRVVSRIGPEAGALGPTLLNQLRASPSPALRQQYLETLGAVQAPETTEGIRWSLQGEHDAQLRLSAVRLLSSNPQLFRADLEETILAILRDGKQDYDLREAAIYAFRAVYQKDPGFVSKNVAVLVALLYEKGSAALYLRNVALNGLYNLSTKSDVAAVLLPQVPTVFRALRADNALPGDNGANAPLRAGVFQPLPLGGSGDPNPVDRQLVVKLLYNLGPKVEPDLVAALKDTDPTVRITAAEAVKEMRNVPLSATVPLLVDALISAPENDVKAAASDALQVQAPLVNDSGVEGTLIRLREYLKGAGGDAALSDSPQKLRERLLEPTEKAIVRLDHLAFWTRLLNNPWFWGATGAAVYIVAMLSLWFVLLRFKPLWILTVNDVLRPKSLASDGEATPNLGAALVGFLKSVFPTYLPWVSQFSASWLTLVKFFDYHPRVLDAWVRERQEVARGQFNQSATARQRDVYIPVEVVFEVAQGPESVASPTIEHFRPYFDQPNTRLLLYGPGGTGKTSLVCQLARRAMAAPPDKTLAAHPMLAVLIEGDLDADAKRERRFLKTVGRRLKELIAAAAPVDDRLVRELLLQRRLLVIVDGVSEWQPESIAALGLDDADFPANSLVLTSRQPEFPGGAVHVPVRVAELGNDALLRFLEEYFRLQAPAAPLQPPATRQAMDTLAKAVHERPVPAVFASLYAQDVIKAGLAGAAPLANLYDLVLRYLNFLNRNSAGPVDEKLLDAEVHHCAKELAWLYVGPSLRPLPATAADGRKALGDDWVGKKKFDYLANRLQLIQVLEPGKDTFSFALDPVAEYLAARRFIEADCAGDHVQVAPAYAARTAGFTTAKLLKIQGFRTALADCFRAGFPDAALPAELA